MIGVLFVTFHEHCGLMRFNILALASTERYISLCHPHGGDAVCFTLWSRARKIKLIAASLWIGGFVFLFVKNYLSKDELCVQAFYGPSTKGSIESCVIMLSYVMIISATIVVCKFKVMRELKKASLQEQLPTTNNLAKQTMYFILIINIAFYIFLMPVGAIVIMGPLGRPITKGRWVIHLLYSSYGVFNVVIYRLVMKPYRTLISSIFWRRSKETQNQCCVVDTPNIPKPQDGNDDCLTVTTIQSPQCQLLKHDCFL